MEEKKKTLTEYERELSEAEVRKEERNRRRKVNSIKRALMVTFVMVCAIPILFCTYLMVRMNQLDRKLSGLVERVENGNQTADASGQNKDSTETLTMDQQAYGDLEKGTESDGVRISLTNSNEQTGEVTEVTTEEEMISEQNSYNGKKVYLTFDDGPSTYTGELLDVLARNNVKATFFVVYNSDPAVEQYYKRIVDEGHAIGMHSYSHVYDTVYASEESFEQDVDSIHDYIYQKTGVDSHLYRFPGGSSNQVSKVDIQELMEYLYNEGITYYDWNSLSGDAVDASLTPDELNENILGYVRANAGDSIVLMHDLQNNHATIESLQSLIDTLKNEGYELCAIEEGTVPVQHVEYKGAE